LLLCLISMFPVIAKVTGLLLHWMIWLMNTFIERMGRLPYAVLGEIQISFLQLISFYIFIIGLSVWLLRMTKKACIGALAGLLIFGIARIHTSLLASQQQKIIVYNIPYHQAIDFIDGKNYVFRGDSVLLEENFLQNFHLRPSRTAQRIKKRDSLPSLFCNDLYFQFHTKSIVIIEGRLPKVSRRPKIQIDLIIISGNPVISMHEIDNIFTCKQIIFDASNSHWKISNWISDCKALRIPYYSIPEKGAFVMNLN